jgi:hypothetical protein
MRARVVIGVRLPASLEIAKSRAITAEAMDCVRAMSMSVRSTVVTWNPPTVAVDTAERSTPRRVIPRPDRPPAAAATKVSTRGPLAVRKGIPHAVAADPWEKSGGDVAARATARMVRRLRSRTEPVTADAGA